jgi:hypothetical protein
MRFGLPSGGHFSFMMQLSEDLHTALLMSLDGESSENIGVAQGVKMVGVKSTLFGAMK